MILEKFFKLEQNNKELKNHLEEKYKRDKIKERKQRGLKGRENYEGEVFKYMQFEIEQENRMELTIK